MTAKLLDLTDSIRTEQFGKSILSSQMTVLNDPSDPPIPTDTRIGVDAQPKEAQPMAESKSAEAEPSTTLDASTPMDASTNWLWEAVLVVAPNSLHMQHYVVRLLQRRVHLLEETASKHCEILSSSKLSRLDFILLEIFLHISKQYKELIYIERQKLSPEQLVTSKDLALNLLIGGMIKCFYEEIFHQFNWWSDYNFANIYSTENTKYFLSTSSFY